MKASQETGQFISADKVEGTSVYNTLGDTLGAIHDLMIDKATGKVAYALMSFGGFLGFGNQYHPLPWSLLKYDPNLGGYVVNLDKRRFGRRAGLRRRYRTRVGRSILRRRDSRLSGSGALLGQCDVVPLRNRTGRTGAPQRRSNWGFRPATGFSCPFYPNPHSRAGSDKPVRSVREGDECQMKT